MANSLRFCIIQACLLLGVVLPSLWPGNVDAQGVSQLTETPSLIPDPLKQKGFLPGQSSPATITLTDTIQQLDISGRISFWIDTSTDTTLDQLLARATSGAELFKPTLKREILPIHGKVLWLRFETLTETRQARWLLEIG